VFGIFPEGHRSKTGDLGAAMNGAAMFALKSQAAVIPVAIIGPYRLFRPIKIVYGQPLDLSRFRESKPTAEILRDTTEYIMQNIKELIERHHE
jgi:1-acyl-sn-glycerol-3-phosphate acyltransferase